jgi:hypothetical protein
MQTKVFAPGERNDWATLKYNESQFEFLDRCAWPLVGLMREWLDEWLIPYEHDKEFISKFRSKSNKQHSAAVFELLIYTMFINNGLNIQRVERGAGKTPDFSIMASESSTVYLECSLAANAMESEEENKKKESVAQYVEEIPDYPFYVGIDFKTASDQSISKKQLLAFLDKFRPPYSLPGLMEKIDYSAQGWELVITLVKKGEGASERTRGFTYQAPRTIDNFKALYGALNGKKAGRYELGESPYIICIGVDDLTANEYEFFSVLFGPQDMNRLNFDWEMNGFFLVNGMPVNTSVSAVLFCKSLKTFGLSETNLSLWHNPFATYPVHELGLPIREIKYVHNGTGMIRSDSGESKSAFELLGRSDELYAKFLALKYRQTPQN